MVAIVIARSSIGVDSYFGAAWRYAETTSTSASTSVISIVDYYYYFYDAWHVKRAMVLFQFTLQASSYFYALLIPTTFTSTLLILQLKLIGTYTLIQKRYFMNKSFVSSSLYFFGINCIVSILENPWPSNGGDFS